MQPSIQLIIFGATSAASGGGLLPAPTAPTLTLTSGATDNQPDFLVTAANADLPVGAVVTISAYSDAGLTTLVSTGQGTVAVAGTLTVTSQLGPLADGTYWYVAVTSISGHADSANSNTETNTIDATAPTISTLSPADNATSVAVASNLVATFSENIAFHTAVVITLKKTSDNSTIQAFTEADIAGALTISGAALTINPTASLAGSTEFYVLIGATSIKDTAGNFFAGIAGTTTWSFTTDSGAVTLDTGNAFQVTFTNGNLTIEATGATGGSASRSTTSRSSGKFYLETTIDSMGGADNVGGGVVNGSHTFASGHFVGFDGNGTGAYGQGAIFSSGGSIGAFSGVMANTKVIGIAVDIGNGRFWARNVTDGGDWNNNAANDPATNTGGKDISGLGTPLYAAGCPASATGNKLTMNFGATAYAGAAPSGFANW